MTCAPPAPANVSSSALMRVGSLTAPGTPCGLGLTSMLGMGGDLRSLSECASSRAAHALRSLRMLLDALGGGNARAGVRVELADLAPHALARLGQLVLQPRELAGAVAHELELAVDVPERLAEQLAAALGVDVLAAQLRAHLGARLLGGEQRLQLLQRDAEQVFQAHHLAQALDLGVAVEAMAPGRPRGRLGQQADLLVVADRARRRADQPRDVADAQALRARRARRSGAGASS